MRVPKVLSELFDKPLNEWSITKVCFLELITPSSGIYPAIYSDSKSMIVCTAGSLLIERLRRYLPERKCKITYFYMLYHREENIGFTLNPMCENNSSLKVLTIEEFDRLKVISGSFRWVITPFD